MIINVEQAQDYIIRCMKAKKTCMLSGSPGIGKSDIVRSIALKFNLKLIDIRLSTCDPTDLQGFPTVQEGIAKYIPMDTFPLASTPKPKGKAGWLIFLDELNSSSLSTQAAAYRLVLDRQVGQHDLHPNVAVVAAGNLTTDGAIVNRLGTAMQSRLVHLELGVEPESWLKWGSLNGIDHRILAYISHVPGSLMKFDPRHDDKTFSCPRTWEFLSDLIANVPTPDLKGLFALLAGTVGESSAFEFTAYTTVYSQIPSYKEILADPVNAPLSNEPATLFAVSHLISAFLKKADIPKTILYIERMPVEIQTITLQNIVQKDPSIIKEKHVINWLATKSVQLL